MAVKALLFAASAIAWSAGPQFAWIAYPMSFGAYLAWEIEGWVLVGEDLGVPPRGNPSATHP
jgi:hypothetical protein